MMRRFIFIFLFDFMVFKSAISIIILIIFFCSNYILFCLSAAQAAAEEEHLDITAYNIEELMNMDITSVGKKSQTLSSSAAAIYVITSEDIRSSGVTTIPDALRMVPGLHVTRISSDEWAINSRSAASRFADKLLVLIDGRSVYSPSFSGVYWEVQDTMISDIDRIEVIRGPGATLWGANAVNGVINIITKKSKDTQGGVAEAGAGTFEKGFASVRYGGKPLKNTKFENNSYARFYAKGFNRDGLATFYDRENISQSSSVEEELNEELNSDGWEVFRGGFRSDTYISGQDTFTIIGDIYKGDISQVLYGLPSLEPPYSYNTKDNCDVSGSNIVAKWQRLLSSSSEWSVQTYFDKTMRNEIFIEEQRNTFDIDFQYRFSPYIYHDMIWGMRFNQTRDTFEETFLVSTNDNYDTNKLFSSFVQDEISLIPDSLWLTVGSKLEHNDYSGYELQPSAKILWSPHNNHKLWGAISRAVRTPSRIEHYGNIVQQVAPPLTIPISTFPFTNIVPVLFNLKGGKWLDSEELMAYEIGYRFLHDTNLSFDCAFFYNDYDKLRKFDSGDTIFHDSYVEQLIISHNNFDGYSWGAEFSVAWQPSDKAKFDIAYTFLTSNLNVGGQIGDEPTNQISLQGNFKPFSIVDINLWLRYVDDFVPNYLKGKNFSYHVDDYFELDANIIWKIAPSIEFSIVGQNLLDDRHVESVQEAWIAPNEVKRNFYGKVTWYF